MENYHRRAAYASRVMHETPGLLMLEWLFWLCVIGIAYIYVLYPLVIFCLARFFPAPVAKGKTSESCTVLIAAYNEAETLPPKIQALLESADASLIDEILIGSDGSDDGTPDCLRDITDSRVRVISFAERRGKPSVLNDLVRQARSEALVFTDARQVIESGALTALMENFADPDVGVVSGELVFYVPDRETGMTEKGLDAYWRYEKCIRRSEARFRSVPGATGALYALRRRLFKPIPPSCVLDDVAIPMQAVMEGARCVFEERAVVRDRPAASPAVEARRKRRTLAGNIQLVRLYPSLILPWRNPIFFEFVSHKILRLLSPFLLLACAGANVALGMDAWMYRITGALQGMFYLLATVGWITALQGKRAPGLSAFTAFVQLNGMTLLGWYDYITGNVQVSWSRTRLSGQDRNKTRSD